MVVAVEAEKAADGDHVRFEYIVRYLSTSATGTPIVQLEIGGPGSRDRITEKPLALDGPPGWTATAIPQGGTNPRTWRLSWSCAHSGWEHLVKHQIRPGQVVRGFRALVPRGAAGYGSASYQVFVDHDRGMFAPDGTTGKVSLRRR